MRLRLLRFFSIQVLIFPGVCDSAPPNLALNRLLAWIEPASRRLLFARSVQIRFPVSSRMLKRGA
jgi:hypothetical protein